MKIILLIIWVGLALASCPGTFLFNGQYVNEIQSYNFVYSPVLYLKTIPLDISP